MSLQSNVEHLLFAVPWEELVVVLASADLGASRLPQCRATFSLSQWSGLVTHRLSSKAVTLMPRLATSVFVLLVLLANREVVLRCEIRS